MPRLSNQSSANGWTDHWVIDYDNATFAANAVDDAASVLTYPVPAGAVVRDCMAYLETAFDDSGSGDELDVIVGKTGGDLDGYLALALIHTDGTEISYVQNTGALLDNENGDLFTTAGSVSATITPNTSTGDSYALSELTAGKLHIYLNIARI